MEFSRHLFLFILFLKYKKKRFLGTSVSDISNLLEGRNIGKCTLRLNAMRMQWRDINPARERRESNVETKGP